MPPWVIRLATWVGPGLLVYTMSYWVLSEMAGPARCVATRQVPSPITLDPAQFPNAPTTTTACVEWATPDWPAITAVLLALVVSVISIAYDWNKNRQQTA